MMTSCPSVHSLPGTWENMFRFCHQLLRSLLIVKYSYCCWRFSEVISAYFYWLWCSDSFCSQTVRMMWCIWCDTVLHCVSKKCTNFETV